MNGRNLGVIFFLIKTILKIKNTKTAHIFSYNFFSEQTEFINKSEIFFAEIKFLKCSVIDKSEITYRKQ